MNNRHLIGIMDSGIGGLSVLSLAKTMIDNCDFIYYADVDNVPYGTKSPDEIKCFTRNAISFLSSKGVDAVIIACNTATSIAVTDMRKEFSFPIIGMEPAVKSAADLSPNGNILVCATPVTISGAKLHHLIEENKVDPVLIATPELVNFAENSVFDDEVISNYLRSKVENPETFDIVVLGCTHFTYYKEAFKNVFYNAKIIDGNLGTVKRAANVLNTSFTLNNSINNETTYYKSGRKVLSQDELDYFYALEKRIN